MPLLNLPGEIKVKKFTKALQRLGFLIDKTGGKGTHIKIIWPLTNKSLTIPRDLRKDVLRYILKQIEEITNGEITWDKIKTKL